MVGMTSTPKPRETFPLRFKDARNREALGRMAEMTGRSMTAIAEDAIAHEVVLLSADLEQRLMESLELVRSYTPDEHLDAYLDAIAAEDTDLGPGLRAVAASAQNHRSRHPHSASALGVLAAFSRR